MLFSPFKFFSHRTHTLFLGCIHFLVTHTLFLGRMSSTRAKKPWIGRKGYGRQSKFDEIVVGRGIRNSYSISPIRRPGTAYVDEKERKDKEPKTQEIGTNTVLTSMVLERILDNLEEVNELMSNSK